MSTWMLNNNKPEIGEIILRSVEEILLFERSLVFLFLSLPFRDLYVGRREKFRRADENWMKNYNEKNLFRKNSLHTRQICRSGDLLSSQSLIIVFGRCSVFQIWRRYTGWRWRVGQKKIFLLRRGVYYITTKFLSPNEVHWDVKV